MSTNTGNRTNTEKVEEKASAFAQRTYGDFLGAYKSFSETTSKVIDQAAMVLESEIASGIKIASQVENRIPQIEKFRSEKPDEVIQRFRRDAHEVVDIFIDVVGATLRSVPNLNEVSILRGGNVTVKQSETSSTQRSVIMAPEAVKAGGEAKIQISFESSRNQQTEEFKLYSTDLISITGDRIPAGLITFDPQALKISPGKTEQITVTVAIPEETAPGTYSGLVLASNMPELRSELVVKVE